MKRVGVLVFALGIVACEDQVGLDRKLASFEITLLTPVGSEARRCVLPGTPTTGFDLTGCPLYERDAAGRTVAVVEFEARALDNHGALLETYNSLASVSVHPGRVEAAFTRVRFRDGIASAESGGRPVVQFRASFGDTFLWITDDQAPPLGAELPPGMTRSCSAASVDDCGTFGLSCVNAKPAVGFDEDGLAYCTTGCGADADCPAGFFCSDAIITYADAAVDVQGGACVRRAPSYASAVAGPIHLVEPNLADINRADSLIASPFEEEFIEVRRGKMVVTAVRIDGFYVTDLCPILGKTGAAPDDDCTADDLALPAEFNHLFVFNFSRPDDLFSGDKLTSVAGPMSEFNGLTEMNFPLWEVDVSQSPYPLPEPVNLEDKIMAHYPMLLERGQRCFKPNENPDELTLLDCDFAMERLEAARVQLTVLRTEAIQPGSREAENLERFGQWPVVISTGRGEERTFQMITRENIPFFDPLTLQQRAINQPVIGNTRQVAFDDRSEPIWIIEPRDQADCPWCVNP